MLPDWWTNREDWAQAREERKLAARQKASEDLASVFEEPVLSLVPTVEPEVVERPAPVEVFQGLGFLVEIYRSSMDASEFYGVVRFPTRHAGHFSGRDTDLGRLRLSLVNLGAQNATAQDVEASPAKDMTGPRPIDPEHLPADVRLAEEPRNRIPAFDVTFREGKSPLTLADGAWFDEE